MEKRKEIHRVKKGEPLHLVNDGNTPLDLTLVIGEYGLLTIPLQPGQFVVLSPKTAVPSVAVNEHNRHLTLGNGAEIFPLSRR